MNRWLEWLLPWWWPVGLSETTPAPGVQRLSPPDGPRGLFGLRWALWGRLALWSWPVMFGASWVGILEAWKDNMPASNWMTVLGLALVVSANAVPGAWALLSPPGRQQLRSAPEAAGLGLLTLSALLGLGAPGLLAFWGGDDLRLLAAAALIGVTSFPLTFGLAFPLAIPLLCAWTAWSWTQGNGGISRLAFGLLSGVAMVGWMGVLLVGLVLGAGA